MASPYSNKTYSLDKELSLMAKIRQEGRDDLIDKIQSKFAEALAQNADKLFMREYEGSFLISESSGSASSSSTSQPLKQKIFSEEVMEKAKERMMGRFLKKKTKFMDQVLDRNSNYKGFAGLAVVDAYLNNYGWDSKAGLLVMSAENYFLGKIYGDFTGKDYFYCPKEEREMIEATTFGGPTELIEGGVVTSVPYDIRKITLDRGGEYYNAIQVQSLQEAERIPNFRFIKPQEIERGAQKYFDSPAYYSRIGDQASMQSEYSMGETEYVRLKALERTLPIAVPEGATFVNPNGEKQVFKKGRWQTIKREKWQKKEEAERQLIF